MVPPTLTTALLYTCNALTNILFVNALFCCILKLPEKDGLFCVAYVFATSVVLAFKLKRYVRSEAPNVIAGVVKVPPVLTVTVAELVNVPLLVMATPPVMEAPLLFTKT